MVILIFGKQQYGHLITRALGIGARYCPHRDVVHRGRCSPHHCKVLQELATIPPAAFIIHIRKHPHGGICARSGHTQQRQVVQYRWVSLPIDRSADSLRLWDDVHSRYRRTPNPWASNQEPN